MNASITPFPRHGQPGYYSLADIPQRGNISEISLSSGWAELDEIWKLYPSQFTLITGTAGHGKSTFLQNVIVNLAQLHGLRTFMYAPENEGFLRDKFKAIWGNRPGFDEFSRTQCFLQSALPEAYDSEPKTLNWVLDRAVVAVERDGVDLIVIDPWNELERAKPADMLLADYIGQCLMYAKQACRAMEVAFVIVAHPTKAGVAQGATPTLSDVEGSMAWYNKCDNGLIIARDLDSKATRVISAKARELGSGRRGCAYFTVDQETGVFTPQYGAVT